MRFISIYFFSASRILILLLVFSGCTKFVEIDPPRTQLVSTDAFNSDASATSAITGLYGKIMQESNLASGTTTYYAGMSADELVDYSNVPDNTQIYDNAIIPTNRYSQSLWNSGFQYIYAANSMIEGLQVSNAVNPELKKELTGEALFVRALCNFYLLNFFGDIPLITSTSYQTNAIASRTQADAVYQQIITDLKNAQADLAPDFIYGSGERIRPVSSAATALLARVYLYMKDWTNAELQATAVINHTDLFSLETDLNNVFLANSEESILQFQPVTPEYDTWEGFFFILDANPAGTAYGLALTDQLIDAFEPGDQRWTNWVSNYTDPATNQIFYYAYKYKIKTGTNRSEYYTVLRLAEQYLIRSEARAMQNNIEGSLEDLNIIRVRAGLPDATAVDQTELLQVITQERRIELFAEWGHRWFDLKRTDQATTVLAPIKPGWQPTDVLFPIPASEIQNDPNLKQNPGYN